MNLDPIKDFKHITWSLTMRKLLAFIFLLFLNSDVLTAQSWQPIGDKIKTRWAKDVSPSNAWNEYPRPQLVRDEWKNLNGLWDYAILPKGSKVPEAFQGKILVPYCVESSLSGVGKPLSPADELFYNLKFDIPAAWKGRNVKLNFGAVDWQSTIYINGKTAGEHTGGSDPFNIDITPFLKAGSNDLVVKVWDPTDSGPG